MSRRFTSHYADAKGALLEKPGVGMLMAEGNTAPTAAASGYANGCHYINRAATAPPFWYVNVGTNTSATWLPFDSLTLGSLARAELSTNDTTVGAATLTAAAIAGGIINRSGSTADYTDTTATATLIIAALPTGTPVGASWRLRIKNTVAFNETLSGGTGVTLSGISIVPPLSIGDFLLTYTAAATLTWFGLGSHPIANLPASQYVTQAYQSATLAAGDITGANICHFDNTGTTPGTLTTRTATQMFGDLSNAQVGQNYTLFIRNSAGAANTLTLGAGTGVTLTGTMTVAQNVTRMFNVRFASTTTCTIQSMGIFAAGA